MNKLCILCMALMIGMGFNACQSECDIPEGKGSLLISLNNISPLLATKATPAELGTPETSNFKIQVTKENGTVVVKKNYSEERIPLLEGKYNVEATFGENPIIGIDAPYYHGVCTATILPNEVTQADLTCKVANALISARFGINEEEKNRFKKFYSLYGLRVMIDNQSAEITNFTESMSVYFRAGTSIELEFFGTLRADGRKVSLKLNTNESTLPSVFQAADHAIVTLSLPDPESAVAVEITKLEMQEASIQETIPLSWLPVPQVTPEHQYDANGNLVGTNLTFSNSYPGMTWKAVVNEPTGTTFRTIEGNGELVSSFADNTDNWVYLPARDYTATFYIINGEQEMKTGTRTFTVGNPDLKVTTSAYTSWSKYEAGDVDGANGCDAYTVYAPVVSLNIAPSIWNNAKYTKNLTVSLGETILEGAAVTSGQEGLRFSFADQTGLTPQFGAYELSANLTFDMTSVASQRNLFLTGLPASWTPPTEGDWSVSGTHDWNGNYNNKPCVRLGQNGTGTQYIVCQKFAVPAGVKVEAAYDVMSHGATVQTTLELSFGKYTYFSHKTSYMSDKNATSSAFFTTGEAVSEAKANNNYGAGQTCSRIYSLTYKYGK